MDWRREVVDTRRPIRGRNNCSGCGRKQMLAGLREAVAKAVPPTVNRLVRVRPSCRGSRASPPLPCMCPTSNGPVSHFPSCVFKALLEIYSNASMSSTAALTEPLFSSPGVIAPTCAAEFSLLPRAIHVYVNSNAPDTGIKTGTSSFEQTQSTSYARSLARRGVWREWRHPLDSEVRREPPHAGQTD